MLFYFFFFDRFVNGDLLNDNVNGIVFEVDIFLIQLWVGGDVSGFMDMFDYFQGMGIKVSCFFYDEFGVGLLI